LRRTIAGIPTRRFRNRLTGMAARRGVAMIGVDAAYTSKWGAQHWRTPLQQQTSDPVTRHHAAAVAIGRRGLGLAITSGAAAPSAATSALRSGRSQAISFLHTRQLRGEDSAVSGSSLTIRPTSSRVATTPD
jgi:hypothetical protein